MSAALMEPATSQPLVSILIVTYNSRPHLARCLAALRRQTYPRFELIVVDNASTDGSADEVAARFPEARLLRLRRNLGFAGGNNMAAMMARGAYLAFLNPDTEAEPDWLSALVASLESDPGAGLATSKILLFDQRDQINTCGNSVHYTGLAFCRGLGQPRAAFDRSEPTPAVSGAAFLMRRALFEQLGGFDERFFMYLEDTDLSLRAALAGFACRFAPESVVYHHYIMRVGAAKTFHLERNRYLMLLKCYQPTTLLLILPALALVEAITWGFALLSGPAHLAAKARAIGWLARHLPAVLAARRQVQATRQVGDQALLRRFDSPLAFEQMLSGPRLRLARALCDRPLALWRRALLAAAD